MITDEFFTGLDGQDILDKTAPKKGSQADSARVEWTRQTRIVQELTSNLDVDSLYSLAMDYAIEITQAERGFLATVSPNGELEFRVTREVDSSQIAMREDGVCMDIVDKVVKTRTPVLQNDVPDSNKLTSKYSLTKLDISSVLCAPMINKDKVIGLIFVDTHSISNIFTEDDLINLETFVNLSTIAIENARLIQNLTQTTQNYRLLKEYHENILKSLPMGIMVVEPDRNVEFINQYAGNLWNVTPEEGVGKKFETLFPKRDKGKEALLHLWNQYLEGKQVEENEIRINDKSYRVSFFDVLRWGRQDVRSGMLLLDISLRKQLEMELVTSEKQATVVQLAGGIAHEVNNLLTPILGRATMAQMRLKKAKDDLPEEIDKDLAIIDEQAKRIKKVVDDLNRLSRPIKPEMDKTCIGKCLASAVELLSDTAGRIKRFNTANPNEQFYLKLDIEPDLPQVKGNFQQIEQMFLNLIINAAQAVEDKGAGQIILKAYRQDDRVVAAVSDTGVGIAPDVLKHVFEPYFTTKAAGRGTGLGMPIVSQIADMHSGTVELETVYGEGTTVIISFPIKRDR